MLSRLLVALLLAGLGCPEVGAQGVSVIGGGVQITVPFVGTGFGTGVNATTRLEWFGTLFGAQQKITTQTFVTGQDYGLSVRAVPTRFGTSAGRVTLTAGAPARNLIVNIPSSFIYLFGARGEAQLEYEATAAAASPAGQDLHTVVYTITQQ